MPETPTTPSPFPGWIILGGLLLAAGFLPTLHAPFDFIDDGNLVYPAPAGTTTIGHVEIWWDKVQANVEHLGPFRPVVWAHWEIAANLFNGDALLWRSARLLWCALAAMGFIGLLRTLNLHPIACLVAGAAALWNPYRNEIWTSLTLAEGVAMPYALLALVAARLGHRRRTWDGMAVLALLICLGCKNTFVALLPAMLILRLFPDGIRLNEGLRRNFRRALLYCLPLLLPIGHFIYFKFHWQPGQYETPGPTFDQLSRIVSWLKGTAGFEFLGLGTVLTSIAVLQARRSGHNGEGLTRYRAALLTAVALFLGGVLVYLPLNIMAARYTMPAIWGADIGLGVLLSGFLAVPLSWPKRIAWGGLAAGLIAMVIVNVDRQEKVAARARMTWALLHHLEATAPTHAKVAWVGGDTAAGELNIEEGIHFRWHLLHRGRGDIAISLFDRDGTPIDRVEIEPLTGSADYRVVGSDIEISPLWQTEAPFARAYRFGRKQFSCRLERVRDVSDSPMSLTPEIVTLMKQSFDNPGHEAELYWRLSQEREPKSGRSTAELKK